MAKHWLFAYLSSAEYQGNGHTCCGTGTALLTLQYCEREDEVTAFSGLSGMLANINSDFDPLISLSSQNRREDQVLIGQDEVWNTLIGWADM